MPIRLTEKYHKVCNIFRSEKTALMSNGSYDGKRGDRRASSLYRPKDEMYPSSHHEDLSESERWSSEPWELDVENEDEIVLVLPDRFYEPDRYSGSDSDVETMSENPLLSKLKRSLFPAAIKPISLQERLVRTQNVWCVPNLNRDRAEKLLRGAEPGNFILRVNQDEDAMVLSRCTVENDERTVRGEESPVTVVRHNIIEVLPRSGYCLTGDKQAHLIFSSLIQLVHFYMRLSRLHCQNGPFLRLPKTILDAKTVGDLEAINRQGSVVTSGIVQILFYTDLYAADDTFWWPGNTRHGHFGMTRLMSGSRIKRLSEDACEKFGFQKTKVKIERLSFEHIETERRGDLRYCISQGKSRSFCRGETRVNKEEMERA
ncbi:unnamed protein product [Calicophoron daubneyi]|uniref:SH2 domain-containing protein n=1 Tax=Calicophoron daubneyi TaxID=300641 RepID=A0AAV2TQK5_CALDB